MAQIASLCPTTDICFKLNIPEATADSGSGDLFFQLTAPSNYEWVALGQGTGMIGANIFVIYTSSTGDNVTISPRLGTGHVMPNFNQDAQVAVIGGSGVSDGKMVANIRCFNCDSWFGGSADFTADSGSWIYAAHSSGGPKDSDSQSESIQQHDTNNAFNWNYANAKGGDSFNPFLTSSVASTSSPTGVPSSSSDSTQRSVTTTTTTTSSSPTTSDTNVDTGSGGRSGLSSGAKAGIGVGAVVIVLFLVLVPYYVLRRRKQRMTNLQRPHEPTQEYQKPELDGREMPRKEREIDGREVFVQEQELDGRGAVANAPVTDLASGSHDSQSRTNYNTMIHHGELADTARRAELSASPRPVEIASPGVHSPQIRSSPILAWQGPLQEVAQHPSTLQTGANSDQLEKLREERRKLEEQI